ncbi:MAG: hypothetical protein ACHBN1_36740 [Heteroscytonema crispum UTEX LB 1556]
MQRSVSSETDFATLLDFSLSFCIHSSDINVPECQIVNTPSKAPKNFYSRIERFGVLGDSVFLEFKPCDSNLLQQLFTSYQGVFIRG